MIIFRRELLFLICTNNSKCHLYKNRKEYFIIVSIRPITCVPKKDFMVHDYKICAACVRLSGW